MTYTPKVSVIVPVYNREKYLRRCVDSICAQTLCEIEIILVDDGSTDGSSAICDEYAAVDSRVCVIHKQNEGMGIAYNTGMAIARGEYIGFVETDDWVEPEMYKQLYSKASEENVDVVKSLYNEWKGGKSRLMNKYRGRDCLNKKLSDLKHFPYYVYGHPSHWSAIYRRSFINQNNIQFPATPGASCQDNGFNWQVFTNLHSLYIVQRGFYNYCKDNSDSSFAQGMKSAMDVLRMRRWIWDKLHEKGCEPIFYSYLTRDTFATAFKYNYNHNCKGLEKLYYARLCSKLWRKDIKKLNFDLFTKRERKHFCFLIKHPVMYYIVHSIV